ncbi:MAG: AAA family ATPase [Ignavibacteriae bacterium]|nr:AAA family ATPase [Ignavibacteriota bacterium]
MNRVEQFLQHGLLPFVGRGGEIERILNFWRGTVESQHLRAFLLTAEAGAGKSRLLSECIERIEGEGGVVVHAKLYPEAANDLASLLAGALWNSKEIRKLLGSQPNESVPAILAALRRLSRLRPTVIVLEDLHLLTVEAIPDLASLLGSLSDETLSLIALARPVQLQARGLLENYLTETVEMKGLEQPDIVELWSQLFGAPAKAKEISLLEKITFGNGLALRSALRAALQSGTVQQRGASGTWRLTASIVEFENILRQSVSLVVEGLVAGLTPEMRDNLACIALLGEVFARETAERVIGSGEQLNVLLETDLLITAGHLIPPIPGLPISKVETSWPASQLPLIAFTHSLLHNYLVTKSDVDVDLLSAVVAENLPLYSLLPFRLLRSAPISPHFSGEVLATAITRCFAVAQIIDRTSNWKESYESVWLTAEYLVPSLEGRVANEEYRSRHIMEKTVKLSLLRREITSEKWRKALDAAMQVTEDIRDGNEARGRLMACSQWHEWHSRHNYQHSLEVQQMVKPLLQIYPLLRYDVIYIYYLDGLASAAERIGDMETLRAIQEMAKELFNDISTPPESRTIIIRRLLKYLLQTYSSEEEIEECWRTIEQIEEEIDEEDPYYGVAKSFFLEAIGMYKEAADLSERVSKQCRDRGVWLNALLCEATRGICRAACGEPVEELKNRAKKIFAEGKEHEVPQTLAESLANQLYHVNLYRGEPNVAEIYAEFGISTEDLSTQHIGVQGIWDEKREVAVSIIGTDINNYIEIPNDVWKIWSEYLQDPSLQQREQLHSLLQLPILRTQDMLKVVGTLHIWLIGEDIQELKNDLPSFTTALDSVRRGLAWLEKRNCTAYMLPLIEFLKRFGEESEGEEWERQVREGAIPQKEEVVAEGAPEKIRISMLGTIRVAMPSEQLVPVRGVRIRTLLGLMVADKLLARPLSTDEFLRLAGGDDPDPEHARKKKNMGVVRLREILGRDAILTDQETPSLNEDLVEVDLIQGDKKIREALEAVSEGALVRALPLVQEVLEVIGGEVPFPTLYDDFFEAVRGDFEHRLRRAVIETARGLSDGGDVGSAETLLRKGFEVLPGDEEISEMLRQALIASGNRVEAERVKMGMSS